MFRFNISVVFSQNYFHLGKSVIDMVKVKNKTKLKKCFKAFERGISQEYMAEAGRNNYPKISPNILRLQEITINYFIEVFT